MKPKLSRFLFLGILIFLNILAWLFVFELRESLWEINFFDVGQGEAILIESPKRQQILIDGGPTSLILEKLGKEMPFWDRTIDLIILTHPERDHLVGLIEVLKRYKVDYILWTGVVRETAEYQEWIGAMRNEGAKIKIAQAGQRIILSKDPSNLLEILYPFENFENKVVKNSNDSSIVAKLIFRNTSFLFTGDISQKIEKKLLQIEPEKLDSDVLKVAHHGSKYSTSLFFLESVLPEIAIIQVGKNSYGHPSEDVLRRLENFAIKVLRTDQRGDIKIIADGENYKIITSR